MTSYDTIIAGGIVIDGRRNPRVRADVGISGGRIAAIGRLNPADAERVIDATGLIVAPGFIDLHTHYDAQIFWDPYCTISSFHGVTSVVIGNCGFGFAPVKPADRDYAMRTLNRVEQIPYDTMKAGMTWTWETYPEFLDALDATPKGVNVLPYVGINPLLSYYMGRDAAKQRQPDEAEYERILGAFEEALAAGACGWSGNRTPPGSIAGNHRDHDGTPFPANVMSLETALRLTEVMGRRNTGFIQFTNITDDPADDKPRAAYCTSSERFVRSSRSGWSVLGPTADLGAVRRVVGVGRVVEVLAFVVIPLGTDNSGSSPGFDRVGVDVVGGGGLGEGEHTGGAEPAAAAA
jgi:N-acyl-D-aspartate/D-glutamate deacylase